MMLNAFILPFFFAQLTKSESHAIQVLFGKKCIVCITPSGTIVCQVQIYDVDAAHGICEAHVQLYALMRHKDYDGHPHLVQL